MFNNWSVWREIKLVHPKGDQSWIFIGRTDAEAEAPILWPPDAKSRLIGKDPDAGKDWRQEKGMTEDETVGWHHRLDGHEFEQAPGGGDGQGSQACCSPWGHRVGHNWATELKWLRERKCWNHWSGWEAHADHQKFANYSAEKLCDLPYVSSSHCGSSTEWCIVRANQKEYT